MKRVCVINAVVYNVAPFKKQSLSDTHTSLRPSFRRYAIGWLSKTHLFSCHSNHIITYHQYGEHCSFHVKRDILFSGVGLCPRQPGELGKQTLCAIAENRNKLYFREWTDHGLCYVFNVLMKSRRVISWSKGCLAKGQQPPVPHLT